MGDPSPPAAKPSDRAAWMKTVLLVDVKKSAPNGSSADAAVAASTSSDGAEPDEGTKPPFGPQDEWEIQNIVIEPDNPTIQLGEKQQFEAQGLYPGGHNQRETEALDWSSSNEDVAQFDDTKKGLAISTSQAGNVTITAREPNTGRVGTTTLTVSPNTSQASKENLDKGEAYRLGYADGQHDDPKNRATLKAANNLELTQAYEEGFAKAQGEADKKWDKVGTDVDKIETSKRPEKPSYSTEEKIDIVLAGGGWIAAAISVIEANGAAFMSRGVVGTSIGAVILIPAMFMVGTEIAEKREAYKQAVKDFVNQFVTITNMDAMERARAMVQATGEAVPDLNDDGKKGAFAIYKAAYSELDDTLRDYINDKKSKDDFLALHNRWVVKLSKQWANFVTNPRFHD
ncbi:MAG TPA: Ig-like domain-containing protein [Stellaceae bacterium]|nr:Ig-like domain-containing protein [Stellaceae bacterium]